MITIGGIVYTTVSADDSFEYCGHQFISVMASEEHQQLLVFLKNTVEGLLISQVSNVWNIYGGLNRLHSAVVRIFTHGYKHLTAAGKPDLWIFIDGIRWLQPIPTASPSNLIEEKPDSLSIPSPISTDKALLWIYKSLENHSLPQHLSWLLSDREHLLSCYHRTAFLCQEKYGEAALICLRAVEQNQSFLLAEIDPSLYLPKWNVKSDEKCHRRCSSFPETLQRNSTTLFTVPDVTPELVESSEAPPASSTQLANGTQQSAAVTLTSDEPPKQKPTEEIEEDVTTKTRKSKELASRRKPWASLPCLEPVLQSVGPVRRSSVTEGIAINNLNQLTIPPKRKLISPPRTLSDSIISKSRRDRVLPPTKAPVKSPTQRKSFIEDGGSSVQPMATGFFPRPLQGQSLTEFLSSGQFSRANAELDRENAHFSISEAIIAAIEQIKCNRIERFREEQADESDEEVKRLKQRLRLRRRQCQEERHKVIWGVPLLSDGKTDTTTTDQSASPLSSSPRTPSESISSDGVDDLELDEAQNLANLKDSGLSISMASLYSEADLSKTTVSRQDASITESIVSAEGVALSLIRQFSDKQLPRASDLKWLVSEQDTPQELLPLPRNWAINPEDGERQSSQLRGNLEWAPPRAQIIFTPHPPVHRRILIAKQKFRCAGCGMKVAPEYAHRFRYCEYLGRYFCTGCHSNQLALIPGRIISKWDFTRCPVSTFSFKLLDQMSTDPLFPIGDLNPSLYKRCRALERCRVLRLQLFYLKDLVFSCHYASEIQELLNSKLPPYMLKDVEMYSLLAMERVKSGSLQCLLRDLVLEASTHVTQCQFCQARGFFCELCKSKEVIFPWQVGSVIRCAECGSCFHTRCSPPVPCPHCRRILNRRAATERVPYAEVATEAVT